MKLLQANAEGIDHAIERLRRGELVAFPTETVYGLGGDASNPAAVTSIFAAKGRPADHPLIVHLPDAASMSEWATDIPDSAWVLAEQFWPGPMALVLNKQDQVSDLITGGQPTVGLRVPEHPVAQQLLKTFGGALAAPSANRFGRISPTTAQHVLDEFAEDDQAVSAVIDAGACPVGVESTIIDLSGDHPRLLRPGMISLKQIEQVLLGKVEIPPADEGPRTAGRLPSHYAPLTPLAVHSFDDIALMIAQEKPQLAVLALQTPIADIGPHQWLVMPDDPEAYAFRLYAELRRLDQMDVDRILVEQPPNKDDWAAINDRLKRASH